MDVKIAHTAWLLSIYVKSPWSEAPRSYTHALLISPSLFLSHGIIYL